MAYAVTKCDVGGSTVNGYHYEYLCESADDIANLPTGADSTEISKPAPGSLALLEDGTVYLLTNAREWSEFSMAGGGGGGGAGSIVVNVTSIEGGEVADKTMREIVTALQAGKTVNFVDKTDGVLDPDNPESQTSLFAIPAIGVDYFQDEGYPAIFSLVFTQGMGSVPMWAGQLATLSLDDFPTTVPPVVEGG